MTSHLTGSSILSTGRTVELSAVAEPTLTTKPASGARTLPATTLCRSPQRPSRPRTSEPTSDLKASGTQTLRLAGATKLPLLRRPTRATITSLCSTAIATTTRQLSDGKRKQRARQRLLTQPVKTAGPLKLRPSMRPAPSTVGDTTRANTAIRTEATRTQCRQDYSSLRATVDSGTTASLTSSSRYRAASYFAATSLGVALELYCAESSYGVCL